MPKLHLRPASPGLVMFDPETRRRLPDDGGEVSDCAFWRRRMAAGEVLETTAPTPIAIAAIPPLTTREA